MTDKIFYRNKDKLKIIKFYKSLKQKLKSLHIIIKKMFFNIMNKTSL